MEALETRLTVEDEPSTLITDKIDIWTSAIQTKAASGRGSSKKRELYGIKKLRELILELAVRGKLVPQDPNDEPASVLLERIMADKARLVKKKKIRKTKVLPEITKDVKPFGLPHSWMWIRLGEIQTFTNGFAFKSQDLQEAPGVGVVKIGDVYRDRGVSKEKMQYISEQKAKEIDDKYKIYPGDFVITMTGDVKIGFNNLSETFLLNQRVGKLDIYLANPKYISFFLLTIADRKIEEASGGVIPNVSTEEINGSLVSLPPLPEQHRIVAKVDELMALCDQLEQQTETSIDAHATLVETLLATLTNSANAAELEQNWTRIADHIDTLFTTDHAIDQLKQTVLQLAVMGKLVPQDPNDEPADVLLEKIAAEKAQLVKEKKIKKQKALPPIAEDEKPFALPEGWEWCRLQDVTNLITDGKHGDCANLDGSGHYFLSAKNIQSGKLVYENARQIDPDEFHEVHQRTNLEPGDICIVNTGATVGKMAVALDSNPTAHTTFQKSVAVIKATRPFLHNLYIATFLKAESRNLLKKSGGSAINNLLLGDLKKKVTPLPPLEEQRLIVAKVDQLITLCDQLKARLQQAQQTQLHLADAMVETALG